MTHSTITITTNEKKNYTNPVNINFIIDLAFIIVQFSVEVPCCHHIFQSLKIKIYKDNKKKHVEPNMPIWFSVDLNIVVFNDNNPLIYLLRNSMSMFGGVETILGTITICKLQNVFYNTTNNVLRNLHYLPKNSVHLVTPWPIWTQSKSILCCCYYSVHLYYDILNILNVIVKSLDFVCVLFFQHDITFAFFQLWDFLLCFYIGDQFNLLKIN